MQYAKKFSEIGIADIALVGGKNASLGEMFTSLQSKNIKVPDGFAVTTLAFRDFIVVNGFAEKLKTILGALDRKDFTNLHEVGSQCRTLILSGVLPSDIRLQAETAYKNLCGGKDLGVAVRSSATAEDLDAASFAGQHESYLNVHGSAALTESIQKCYASLYTDRAIKYREDNGVKHENVLLSVGVQLMVRSDSGSSGVAFTLEPESGFRDIVHISGVWGLGENIVQGAVTPDEFYVFKPFLYKDVDPVIQHKLGDKELTMRYALGNPDCITVNIETEETRRLQFVLTDAEVVTLARWAFEIENHYGKPMDLEWAKDGESGELFILQARPETVHSRKKQVIGKEYTIAGKGNLITSGNAVGSGAVSGFARLLDSPAYLDELLEGEIVVTNITSPDWDPVLKKAAAIVTNKGGRTSHAAIVAREQGIPAVVGCNDATYRIKTGDLVTVSCCEGKTGFVYDGRALIKERNIDFDKSRKTSVKPMLITGNPDLAFRESFYPVDGVGLLRMEFMITHTLKVHPMALLRFESIMNLEVKEKINKITAGYADKKTFFIEKLAEGIATVAAAFYPREVIVRMSDLKTNEYASLVGGEAFEPEEENPMLGFRGASRYYHEKYREGFALECAAVAKVRYIKGLTNVKIMIPFCRTFEEGRKVIELLNENGLDRSKDPMLQVYVMAEIPSNIVLAEEFGRLFDGFSIGSNDLTQLVLGIDRDSSDVSGLFNEKDAAVTKMIGMLIQKAHAAGKKVGICGQAPSDYPEFVRFLVSSGIDSISFTADALFKGIDNIVAAETEVTRTTATQQQLY